MKSIKLEEIFNHITPDVVILKIDVEGYECKALQPEILMNKLGKFIPYIFMEWGQLPKNNQTCSQFVEWVKHFYEGGYIPVNSGSKEFLVSQFYISESFQELWKEWRRLNETRCGTLPGFILQFLEIQMKTPSSNKTTFYLI